MNAVVRTLRSESKRWFAPARRRAFRMLRRRRLLEALDLEQRRSFSGIALPGIGLLAAGALIGAGAILLFAPRFITERGAG